MLTNSIILAICNGDTLKSLGTLNPKLLDNGGEIPKSQSRSWRFDSQL